MDARRQFEQTHRQRFQVRFHFGCLHYIGVLGVQIAQTDRVACLAAIEAAFLCSNNPIIETERIDRSCTHAARRRRADDDYTITAQQGQISS